MPVATGRLGAVAIPAVGELVLVQFVGGDINAPVITGRLYNDEDRPPGTTTARRCCTCRWGAETPTPCIWSSRAATARELLAQLGKGLTLALRDDDPVVQIDADGKAKATIDRDRKVAVKLANGKLELKADAIEITIEATGKADAQGRRR